MAKTGLKKEARGRECMIRIPGVCNGNSETVVLAHHNKKRLFGAGVGMKVPDIFGAWACSSCHDVVDGRTPTFCEDIELAFNDGIFRTQNQLLKEGKIEI